MSLKAVFEVRHTLAFRLTLWYAGVFIISACLTFLFLYLLMDVTIRGQTDQDLESEARTFIGLFAQQGSDAVMEQALLRAKAAGEKKVFYRLLSINGQVFSSSNMSGWQDISVSRRAIALLLQNRTPTFDTIKIRGRPYGVRVLYVVIGPGVILQLGQSMEGYARLNNAFRKIFIVTMAVLFVLAVGVGWFMARRALSGVAEITQTARSISGGRFEERVPVKKRGDEIDQLADTFNQMLDYIQLLISNIREMSDNIAHDLKSPITRIRGASEVALTTQASLKEYEVMAAGTIEECDRLLDMINTMLIISKTEAGVNPLEKKNMDVGRVVEEACLLFQSFAEDKRQNLACNIFGAFYVEGDIRLIQRMIANLLDNAIKYTPEQGRIEVIVQPGFDGMVAVTVRDSGTGISAEDLPHIFERFYRCDPSRSQPGTGLGLSFARAVVQAHGGQIAVDSEPDKGSNFMVTLPVVPPPLGFNRE